jgi:maltose alpha-D-glucosyltransferase/alpha-amylase
VRRLTALRHAHEDLQADAPFAVANDDESTAPFVYRRGSLLLAVNPSSQTKRYESDLLCGKELIYQIGEADACDRRLTMRGQSFAILA